MLTNREINLKTARVDLEVDSITKSMDVFVVDGMFLPSYWVGIILVLRLGLPISQ